MREWMSKPLVLVAVVVLVLGAIMVYWLASVPSTAAGGERVGPTAYHRQVDRIMRQIDEGR